MGLGYIGDRMWSGYIGDRMWSGYIDDRMGLGYIDDRMGLGYGPWAIRWSLGYTVVPGLYRR